jgi:hypothetical protein
MLTPIESAVSIEFNDWEFVSGEQVLVLLSSTTRLDQAGPITLDYLTWEGRRGSLVTFSLAEDDALQAEIKSGTGEAVLITYLPIPFSDRQEFIINFTSRDILGIKDSCETQLPLGIGSKYVALGCLESKLTWTFLDISNPLESQRKELPEGAEDFLFLAPLWMDSNRILLIESFDQAACTGDVTNWDPVCKSFDFWLGPISPDGKWFEVRYADTSSPESMGIISSNCLLLEEEECFPIVASAPLGMAPSDSASRYVKDAVWLPNSSELLYIVTVNTDLTTMRAERSEIWHYDLGSKVIELLYDLPGDLIFGDPWFELAPAPWSPDGSSVVVKDGGSFMLLNVETGVLTPLTEGGVLLGTITLP